MPAVPKGIRLNNPGNIERGLLWLGLADVQSDPRFCTFKEPIYGIRAICVILRTYNRRYKLKTIDEIINRWAPSHENPTSAYQSNVAKWTGLDRNEVLDFDDDAVVALLAKAITRQENAIVPYDDELFIRAAMMATKK